MLPHSKQGGVEATVLYDGDAEDKCHLSKQKSEKRFVKDKQNQCER